MLEAGSSTRVPTAMGRHGIRLLLPLGLLAVLIGVGVGAAIALTRSGSAPSAAVLSSRYGLDGQAVWPPGAHAAPAIDTLRDQSGRRFSLASLRGHTVAIVFFDSYCHQQCPLEGRDLATAERLLPAAMRPVLVAVSVNPLDTPASARRAVQEWGLAPLAPWHWLMGSREVLARVWRAYHIYVAPHPVNGDIAHTEAVYLVDRRGYERSAYLYPFASRFVAHDLRVLARGKA
jgi:cytochrome oxidase Cu insertion factor (SCO1/SenC/PrrC family)